MILPAWFVAMGWAVGLGYSSKPGKLLDEFKKSALSRKLDDDQSYYLHPEKVRKLVFHRMDNSGRKAFSLVAPFTKNIGMQEFPIGEIPYVDVGDKAVIDDSCEISQEKAREIIEEAISDLQARTAFKDVVDAGYGGELEAEVVSSRPGDFAPG